MIFTVTVFLALYLILRGAAWFFNPPRENSKFYVVLGFVQLAAGVFVMYHVQGQN